MQFDDRAERASPATMVLTSSRGGPSEGCRPKASGEAVRFSNSARADVLRAMERTYADLMSHHERIERKNEETQTLRRNMVSGLDSLSDGLIVLDRHGRIEDSSASLASLLGPGRRL